MRLHRRSLFLVALAVGATALASLAACGGDPSGPDEPTLDGSYQLIEINGHGLPFVYGTCGFANCELIGARLVVRSRGRILDIKQSRVGTPQVPDTQAVPVRYAGRTVFLTRTMPVASDSYVDTLHVVGKDRRLLTVRMRRLFRLDPGGPYSLVYSKE